MCARLYPQTDIGLQELGSPEEGTFPKETVADVTVEPFGKAK